MLSINDIALKKEEIDQIAEKCGVESVKLFGSVARVNASKESDVDLLVEVKEGTSLLSLGGFQTGVEQLLGRKVDVMTPAGLKDRIRQRTIEEAVNL